VAYNSSIDVKGDNKDYKNLKNYEEKAHPLSSDLSKILSDVLKKKGHIHDKKTTSTDKDSSHSHSHDHTPTSKCKSKSKSKSTDNSTKLDELQTLLKQSTGTGTGRGNGNGNDHGYQAGIVLKIGELQKKIKTALLNTTQENMTVSNAHSTYHGPAPHVQHFTGYKVYSH
tara:strand:- start:155 stop:664 length:510 start_codon:yes stop_codon:yes gene_type:complete